MNGPEVRKRLLIIVCMLWGEKTSLILVNKNKIDRALGVSTLRWYEAFRLKMCEYQRNVSRKERLINLKSERRMVLPAITEVWSTGPEWRRRGSPQCCLEVTGDGKHSVLFEYCQHIFGSYLQKWAWIRMTKYIYGEEREWLIPGHLSSQESGRE